MPSRPLRARTASACAAAAACALLVGCRSTGGDSAAAPGADATLILTGGTVIASASAAPIDDGVVVIAGDTIVDVGSRGDVEVPEATGAEVVDVSGRWIIPGLMDLHTHPGGFVDAEQQEMLETVLALGVTSMRSTSMTEHGGGPGLRARLDSGGLTGPRLWVAGPLIDRPGGQFPFVAAVQTPDDVRTEVRRQAGLGVDYIKVYTRLEPPLVSAAIEEAHARGLKVLGHLGRTGWMEAARLGIDGLTHSGPMGPTWELLPERDQPAFREMYAPGSQMEDSLFGRWVGTLPPSQERIDELAAVLRDNAVEVNPNLVLIWAITYGREQRTFDVLETRFAPPTDREAWGTGPPNPRTSPEEFAPLEKRMYAHAEALVRQLHERGVLITAGSDFPMDWMTPGVSLHVELQRLQAAGITAGDVLRIATVNGAIALGVSDRLGTIERGKLADIVVLRADPREDIANTRAIEAVVKGGRLYRPEELLSHRR